MTTRRASSCSPRSTPSRNGVTSSKLFSSRSTTSSGPFSQRVRGNAFLRTTWSNEAKRQWRAKKIAAGLCGICGQHPLVPGLNYCQVCRERISRRAKELRIVVCTLCAVPGHHRRQHKKLGLCWHCNKKAPSGLCKYHREESAERHRERVRKARAGRQKRAVCRRCGKPSYGKTLCPPHLKYMARWQKDYRLSRLRLQGRISGTPRQRPRPG